MLLMGPGGYEDGGGPDGGGLTAAPVEMRVFWDISAEENVILYDVFCED
jgi:hypothetical protein